MRRLSDLLIVLEVTGMSLFKGSKADEELHKKEEEEYLKTKSNA